MINDTFLKACRGEKTGYTPVWVMRQAGRYLPEYQKVRGQVSFLELCKTPELCVEVTLQPITRFGMDAAILFSDILVLMEAMGAPLEFSEGVGPVFPAPIRSSKDLQSLGIPDPEQDLRYVMDTIRLLVQELKVPLIGFAGAPFTCLTYLVEGGSSKVFWETKKMMYTAPTLFHAIMEKITTATILYLQAQIRAGVHAIQLFDSWAGILAPCDYEQFVFPYVQQIFSSLKKEDLPTIYFATTRSGADVIGLDCRINIGDAIKRVGHKAVQGNLDPFALLLPEEALKTRIARLLEAARDAHGHIFNLGHGIHQYTPPKQLKLAVDYVHELSAK